MRRPTPFEVYAASLAVTAVSLAAILIGTGGELRLSWGLALLAAVALIAERQPVRVSANLEMTVSLLPVLFAAVVYGPVPAMVVASLGLLVDLRPPFVRWLTWTSMRALGGALAGVAAASIGVATSSFGRLIAAVSAAVLTQLAVDAFAGAGVVALRRSGSVREYVTSMWLLALAAIPLYTSVLVVLAYSFEYVSPWSVVLFFGPAFAAHRFHRMYREERDTAEQLKLLNAHLEHANLSFATALVATLDARDQYTAGHSAAVAIYSRDIARRMGLPESDERMAHLAGLVHDIGKVGLPAGLLEKAGPLSLEERRQMEKHSEIGERILRNVDDYDAIARIVRHHHERFDGRGYPDGLASDEIPVLSRIIAVADAYNAMTSDRPYRDAMPSRVARLRLAQAVETQFDTTVVAAFEAILAGADESYRTASGPEFGVGARQLVVDAPDVAVSAA